MTATFLIVVFFGALGLLGYMMFFGFDRMLVSYVRNQLQPGDRIVFESGASRSSTSFPSFMFSFRQGYLMVTDRRFVFASWAFPPLWKSITDVSLSDINDVKVVDVMFTQVYLTIGGKQLVLMARANRLWPFSRDRGEALAEAINRGRVAHA